LVAGWSRRRWIVTACCLAGGLAIAWAVVVVVLLLGARRDLDRGADRLRAVRRETTVAGLIDPSTRRRLAEAERDFARARDRLGSGWLAPVRITPVASRQLRAATRLASTSQRGATIAHATVTRLAELAHRPHRTGPERLAVLDDLGVLARRTRSQLAALDPGSSAALVGPLGDAVDELDDQRAQAIDAADQLAQVSAALRALLAGPRPYLLLGANNGEMRAGSGMYLSAAELALGGGRMRLGEVAPTASLVLPEGTVKVTGDLAENWPWLDPGRDLRTLGFSPDLPQSARVALRTWDAIRAAHPELDTGHGPPIGVVVVDVDAIRSLLRVVGPVEVGDVRYTADTVRGELLREQYRRFDDDQAARRDQLGEVARAVFERLEAGRWDFADLASELADAVAGRHLQVWSTDPDQARAWSAIGADGHLRADSLSVALVSRSATKVDSWIETSETVSATLEAGGRRRVAIRYRIDDTAPTSGPTYLVGPVADGLGVGDHRGLVVANLPAGTTEVAMDGARVFLQGGDGPTVVIGGEVTVRRGRSVTVTITALLPAGLDEVTLEPSARIPRTRLVVEGRTYDRDRRRSVRLGP
jgi:hypothetical protein